MAFLDFTFPVKGSSSYSLPSKTTPTPLQVLGITDNPYPALSTDIPTYLQDNDSNTTTVNPYPAPPIIPTPYNSQSNPSYRIYLPIIIRSPLIYDRTKAVLWADQWAHARPSCFPNYGSEDGCNDCTNYLSQVIYAGGYSLIFEPASDVDSWYYWCDEWCLCTNSNTWSATDWLNMHADYYADRGIRYEYKTSINNLEAGDFIIMDLYFSPVHGIPNHARVIVGWGYPQEGDNLSVWSLLANQHCTDRKRVRWNYNLRAEDLLWFWHVKDTSPQ